MKTMKEIAEALLAARSNLLNRQDDLARAKAEYVKVEAEYMKACDGKAVQAVVCQSTAISVSRIWPDSIDGEHLDFELVEVL